MRPPTLPSCRRTLLSPRGRRPAPRPRSVLGAPSVALLFLLTAWTNAGCEGCQRERRPYTPYHIDARAPVVSPSASATAAPTASVAPAAFVPVEARRVNPPSQTLTAAGGNLELPKELAADLVLEGDFTGDGQPDVLAWLRPTPPAGINRPWGELWLFPHGNDARRLMELPGWMPTTPGCVHDSAMVQVGAGHVVLDVTARCEARLPERVPKRLIAVLVPGSERPVLLGLRLAEPAPGESLEVHAESADRDQDGRQDVALHLDLAIDSVPGRARADLGWLDRAAGPARESSVLLGSLTTQVDELYKKAQSRKEAPEAQVGAARLRRLLATLCGESGTSRIWDLEGRELSCPDLAAIHGTLARAEIRAALTRGNVLDAAALLEQASEWFSGLGAGDQKALAKSIESTLTTVDPKTRVALTTTSIAAGASPHYSPLWFTPSGALLIQTQRLIAMRVQPDGTTEQAVDEPASPWTLPVEAEDGRVLMSVVPACDRSEVLLVLGDRNRQLLPPLPTPLLSPRPGMCRGGSWQRSIAPIRWSGDAPTLLVGAACSDPQDPNLCLSPARLGPSRPGSPRSPDGSRMVVVSTLGLLVIGGPKPERWSGAALGDTLTLRDCVVANGATAVACLRGHEVVFVTRIAHPPAPPAPPSAMPATPAPPAPPSAMPATPAPPAASAARLAPASPAASATRLAPAPPAASATRLTPAPPAASAARLAPAPPAASATPTTPAPRAASRATSPSP
jgi:hypothetical protein